MGACGTLSDITMQPLCVPAKLPLPQAVDLPWSRPHKKRCQRKHTFLHELWYAFADEAGIESSDEDSEDTPPIWEHSECRLRQHHVMLEAINATLEPFDLTTPSARKCDRMLSEGYRGIAYVIKGKLHSTINISSEQRQKLLRMKELEWLEAFTTDLDAQMRCPLKRLQSIIDHVKTRYHDAQPEGSAEELGESLRWASCVRILCALLTMNAMKTLEDTTSAQEELSMTSLNNAAVGRDRRQLSLLD